MPAAASTPVRARAGRRPRPTRLVSFASPEEANVSRTSGRVWILSCRVKRVASVGQNTSDGWKLVNYQYAISFVSTKHFGSI